MKQKFILASLLILTVTTAAAMETRYLKLLGTPVRADLTEYANRTITITPESDHFNVVHYETIRFISGNASFIWTFDGNSFLRTLSLRDIAPPGFLDHDVTIYLLRSDKDMDGSH